jgi:hypothetical protein
VYIVPHHKKEYMLTVFEKRGLKKTNEINEEEGVEQRACTTAVRNTYTIFVGSPKQESTRETQK